MHHFEAFMLSSRISTWVWSIGVADHNCTICSACGECVELRSRKKSVLSVAVATTKSPEDSGIKVVPKQGGIWDTCTFRSHLHVFCRELYVIVTGNYRLLEGILMIHECIIQNK